MVHRARLDTRRPPRAPRASSLAVLVLLAATTACGGGKTSGVGGSGGPATLQTIEVLPANASIPKGLTRTYSATGHYSDGSTRDLTATASWAAADPTVASAAANVLRGLEVGATEVRATVDGVTGATGVTVGAAVVSAVTLSPAGATAAAGTTARLTAAALYSDGSRQDATATATWAVTPGSVAAVAGAGVITATTPGNAVVTATVAGVAGAAPLAVTAATLSSIVVSPAAPRVPAGAVQQLTATGLFSDGSAQDLTADVGWTSSVPTVATVSSTGLATPLGAGVTTVRASRGGTSGTTTLTVTAATLVSVAVSPSSLTLAAGTSSSLVATALYSDGTRRDVTALAGWTSSSGAATASGGLVTAVAAGPATVTATFGSAQGSATITVTNAALVSIVVSPSGVIVPAGLTQALTAVGTFSDASTQDLTAAATWTSSVTSCAAVSNAAGSAGVVTALAAGPVVVRATFAGVTGSAPLTVSGATLASLDVVGASTVHAGEAVQFRATGRFSDTSTRELTAQVVWTSSGPGVAAVSNAAGLQGLAAGLAAGGPVTIGARLGAVAGGAPLTVLAPRLLAVAVSPEGASVPKGLTRTFAASGTFGDGSVEDLTGAADWATVDGSIARATGSVVRGEEVGFTSVLATYQGMTGSATLLVTPAVTVAVTVTPAAGSIAAGTKLQYEASAVLSDGTKADVTASATWAATPGTVATVLAGLASAVGEGSATLSATSDDVTGSAALAVTSATLSSIVISPAAPRVALGFQQPLSAIGLFSDGSAQDLTAQVTWSASPAGVATVSAAGLVTPVAAGSTTLRASLGGISGTTPLTVTDATLVSVAVSPRSATIAAGTTTRFSATATWSDFSTQDVTRLASWSSSVPATAVVAGGVAAGLAEGSASITATFGGRAASAALDVTAAALRVLVVTPAGETIPAGTDQQLTATGAFSDGSTQDLTALSAWVSSAPTVAAVSNAAGREGLATGLAAGATTVTAAVGLVSGSAPLAVSAATLAGLDVQPATTTVGVGGAVAFRCTGAFSDGSHRDVTAEVAWSSSDPALASVSSAPGSEGVARGVAEGGPVTVTARAGGFAATAALTVVPAALVGITVAPSPASVAKGLTEPFTATGVYADGSTRDVTSSATWSTAEVSIAVATGNVVRGVDVGLTTVEATIGDVTGSASLVVTPALVVAIALTPADGVVAAGTSTQYDAVAIYSDGSRVDVTAAATWGPLADPFAVAAPGGVVTGVSAGTATISATYDGVTGTAPLTVTAATLSSIVVSPAAPRVPLGVQQPFAATGLFSDASTQDLTAQVTWSSTVPGVATISGAGVATPVSAGPTVIRATLGLVSGETTLTVTAATLVSVTVTPGSGTFAAGTTFRFTATATYSDLTTRDVTGSAAWTSSDPLHVTVDAGLATGVAAGGATLTATLSGVAGHAVAEVTSAALRTLGVAPAGLTIPAGVSQPLTATGAFSDGSTQDLTAAATWTSAVTTVAAVSNAPGREGVVTGLAPGATLIAAAVGAVGDAVPLTVSAATLASLEVQPATTTVPSGGTLQYRALGTYTDASIRDLTAAVTWTSSAPAVATISSAAGSEGLAKGLAPGPATITAQLGTVTQTATLQVVAPVLVSIVLAPSPASVPKGLTVSLGATGHYSDGQTQDLTATATWSTLDPLVAIASGNVVRGLAVGVTVVEATYGGVTGTTGLVVTAPVVASVTVSPAAATLAAGTSVQYGAVAVYSDGAKVDVTATALWAATPEGVATVSAGGSATGLAPGAATVSATAGGVTGSAPLTVTAATLASLAIAPTAPTVPLGVPQQFTATGIFTDGTREDLTTQVAWDSSVQGVATISATGLAEPVGVGGTVITASRGLVATTTTLTVTSATLSALVVDQGSATIAGGTTFQFTATATYSDGSTADATALALWSSTSPGVATVSNAPGSQGLATGLAPGTTDVTAALGGQSDFAPLTVTTAALVAIAVSPATATLPPGTTQAFVATGTFADGSTQDLTALAGWTSSVTTCAAVSNAPGEEGLVTAIAAGATRITAAYQGLAGTADLTVSGAALASIDVTPLSTTVPVGYTRQFRATATYTDTSTRDVTGLVTWTSSSPAFATISNGGLATGVAAGAVTLTAQLSGHVGTASLTVVATNLQSVVVTPNPFTVTVAAGPQHTLQMTATGVFQDGERVDITRQVSWSSSARKRASVSKTGLVTGVAASTNVSISARKGNRSGSASGQVL